VTVTGYERVSGVPAPQHGLLRKRCICGRKFWKERDYRRHYLVDHLLAPPKPTPR
jgi:hypothetical protein